MNSAIALAVILLCGFFASPLHAQVVEVSGQVVDEMTGRPISGARINLRVSSVLLASVVTDSVGRFVIHAPRSPATLTVEAMGMLPRDTTFYTAGTFSIGRVHLSARPIELEGINAEGRAACEASPEALRAGAEQLDRAREPFQEIATNDHLARTEYVMELVRTVPRDWRGRGWKQDTTRARLPSPLMSESPQDLRAMGFAVATDDSTNVYFPPTAEWFASSEFPESYCIASNGPEDGQRTVRFWPKHAEEQVGIDGVLHLDEEGHPQRVEFTYTALRRFLEIHELPTLVREFQLREGTMVVPVRSIQIDSTDHGGQLSFQQVAAGTWMTSSWEVRGARLTRRALWERGELKGVWPRAVPWITAGRLLAVVPTTR